MKSFCFFLEFLVKRTWALKHVCLLISSYSLFSEETVQAVPKVSSNSSTVASSSSSVPTLLVPISVNGGKSRLGRWQERRRRRMEALFFLLFIQWRPQETSKAPGDPFNTSKELIDSKRRLRRRRREFEVMGRMERERERERERKRKRERELNTSSSSSHPFVFMHPFLH